MKVFISYAHINGDWVLNRLQPVLEAAGVEVVIDRERFKSGPPVKGQMDGAQDKADKSLLVLTPEYLQSEFCMHEMDRALSRNSASDGQHVVPIVRGSVDMPDAIEPLLWTDLIDDRNHDAWNLLMRACESTLSVTAPVWLESRDRVLRHLQNGQSVNLVTSKNAGNAWRTLVSHLNDHLPQLGLLDLMSGAVNTRPGFVRKFLDACQASREVPGRPDDLTVLDEAVKRKEIPPIVALTHFEIAPGRASEFDNDLFYAIRHLIDERKLTLLIQSREKHFAELLPPDHVLSFIDIRTVPLSTGPAAQ